MTRVTNRTQRHLLDIERRLDALERSIRALERLRSLLGQRSTLSPVAVLDFVSLEGEVAQ